MYIYIYIYIYSYYIAFKLVKQNLIALYIVIKQVISWI